MLLSGLKGMFVPLSGVSGTAARHVTKKHFSFPDGFHPGFFHGSADCESIMTAAADAKTIADIVRDVERPLTITFCKS